MTSCLSLNLTQKSLRGEVNLPLSKSLCNRALVLSAQFPQVHIAKLSDAEDTRLLHSALHLTGGVIDVGAAGTAMRFATAFFASKPDVEVVLSGSQRMHQRPIGVLVDALRQLGAEIEYAEKEGFPPLRISGKNLDGGLLNVPAGTSSQYISALLLIAPSLKTGLQLQLVGEVVSAPYIAMTVGLLRLFGAEVLVQGNTINVKPNAEIIPLSYLPEADWSAAAYWYGVVALAEDAEILLRGLTENSLQGDARLARIFEELGVKTTFTADGALLQKRAAQLPAKLVINSNDTPDLAQPLAVTCAALGIGADFRGLQTLRIKETDRLLALQNELAKVGVLAAITESSIAFSGTKLCPPTAAFETYEDHRMAMSFALLASKFAVDIEQPEVVAKSYPGFWEDVERVGTRGKTKGE
jgi:3-phosphoshikimate 1-carboxyvinyltransferase